MKKCPKCGREYADTDIFCENCGVKLEKVEKPVEKKTSVSTTGRSASSSSADRFFQLADDEIVVRDFAATKGGWGSLRGRLMVTNKRLIYYGSTSDSRIYQETPIESVGTIQIYRGNTVNPTIRFISVIMAIIAVVLWVTMGESMAGTGAVLLLIAVLLFFMAVKGSAVIRIMSNNASGQGIAFGNSNTRGSAFYIIEGDGDTDLDEIIKILGAMVMDLKQKGNLAVDRWKK